MAPADIEDCIGPDIAHPRENDGFLDAKHPLADRPGETRGVAVGRGFDVGSLGIILSHGHKIREWGRGIQPK